MLGFRHSFLTILVPVFVLIVAVTLSSPTNSTGISNQHVRRKAFQSIPKSFKQINCHFHAGCKGDLTDLDKVKLRLIKRSAVTDYGAHFSVENYVPPQLLNLQQLAQEAAQRIHQSQITSNNVPHINDRHGVPEPFSQNYGRLDNSGNVYNDQLTQSSQNFNQIKHRHHLGDSNVQFQQEVSPIVPTPIPDWPPNTRENYPHPQPQSVPNSEPQVENFQFTLDPGGGVLQEGDVGVGGNNFDASQQSHPHYNEQNYHEIHHDGYPLVQQDHHPVYPTTPQEEHTQMQEKVLETESHHFDNSLQPISPTTHTGLNPNIIAAIPNQTPIRRGDYYYEGEDPYYSSYFPEHSAGPGWSHGEAPGWGETPINGLGWDSHVVHDHDHYGHHVVLKKKKEELLVALAAEVAWKIISSYIFVLVANAVIGIIGKFLGLSDSYLETKLTLGKDARHPFEHYGSGGGSSSSTSPSDYGGGGGRAPAPSSNTGWGKDTYYPNNPWYHPASALYHHPTYQYYPKGTEYTMLGYDQHHAVKYAKKYSKKYAKKAHKFGLKPKPILPYIPAYNYGDQSIQGWGRDDDPAKRKQDKLGKVVSSEEKSKEDKGKVEVESKEGTNVITDDDPPGDKNNEIVQAIQDQVDADTDSTTVTDIDSTTLSSSSTLKTLTDKEIISTFTSNEASITNNGTVVTSISINTTNSPTTVAVSIIN